MRPQTKVRVSSFGLGRGEWFADADLFTDNGAQVGKNTGRCRRGELSSAELARCVHI